MFDKGKGEEIYCIHLKKERGPMKKPLSVALSMVLGLGLSTGAQAVSPWALDGLCEAESLDFLTVEDMAVMEDALTPEKLALILAQVEGKLALLGEAPRTPLDREGDLTRKGVLTALYDRAAGFSFEGLEGDPVACMARLGVIQGDETGDYALERTCTLQEALLFSQRLVLALYDGRDAGSRGLLWKAEHGDNTLYLFGSYHVDKGNLYPFHQSVREAILDSQTVCFEIDFGDAEGARELLTYSYYPEGDCLKNHLEEADYEAVVEALAPIGLDEATVNTMQAWMVGTTLEQLASVDNSTGTSNMATDLYLYTKTVTNGKLVDQVESHGYQGALLSGLSEETQAQMVKDGLTLLKEGKGQPEQVFAAWQSGDLEGFEQEVKKDKPVETPEEQEMMDALFGERDQNMTAWCETFLSQEGEHTATMVVGAGHMIGKTGVVENLRGAGYSVTPLFRSGEAR